MRNFEMTLHVGVAEESELSPVDADLLKAAKEATFRSYVPYSNFHVGAAARLSDGSVVTGCNQENCAYPSVLCAERTTLFYANANFPDLAVTDLSIAARDTRGNFTELPVPPCGACRQVMVETEERFNHPIRLILYGTKYSYIINSAKDILPLSFDAGNLD